MLTKTFRLTEETAWVRIQAVYRQATRNSHREWQYHRLHVYNCVLLRMSTWGSKHVEENSILWTNNNQCIELVIVRNWYSQFMMHGQINILTKSFTKYQLNTQFLYSSTICMLHYDPQHVSSSTLLILRRTNCITTASGIVTLCKQPYSMHTLRLFREGDDTRGCGVLLGMSSVLLETCWGS